MRSSHAFLYKVEAPWGCGRSSTVVGLILLSVSLKPVLYRRSVCQWSVADLYQATYSAWLQNGGNLAESGKRHCDNTEIV